MEVVEEMDVADEELLRTSAAKKAGAQPPAALTKDMKMSAALTDDSYGECFPDTYQGYSRSLAIGGEDDEEDGMIVRSRKEEEEAQDGAGGKRGGKKGGVDVEALKREAKMDRDLVQIEKLMEERSRKRQRRDEGVEDATGDD